MCVCECLKMFVRVHVFLQVIFPWCLERSLHHQQNTAQKNFFFSIYRHDTEDQREFFHKVILCSSLSTVNINTQ